MTSLERALERIASAVRQSGHGFAVVGGLAVSARATPRLTRDADLAVAVHDDPSAEALIRRLRSSGYEPNVITPTVSLPVASIGHLVATKLLARDDRHRPTDADDLRALAAVAAEDDWQVATEAVTLIEQRGYHRGRDLSAALASLRSSGAY